MHPDSLTMLHQTHSLVLHSCISRSDHRSDTEIVSLCLTKIHRGRRPQAAPERTLPKNASPPPRGARARQAASLPTPVRKNFFLPSPVPTMLTLRPLHYTSWAPTMTLVPCNNRLRVVCAQPRSSGAASDYEGWLWLSQQKMLTHQKQQDCQHSLHDGSATTRRASH